MRNLFRIQILHAHQKAKQRKKVLDNYDGSTQVIGNLKY